MDLNKMESYPVFRPLVMSDKLIFDEAFSEIQPQVSELTFTNLFGWRSVYDLGISTIEEFLLIRSTKPAQNMYFGPIGCGDKPGVIRKILNDDPEAGFFRIPESTRELIEGDDFFTLSEDPDNSDYIFKADDLITLRGRKYDGKRNLIKKFRTVNKYEYLKIDGTNSMRIMEFEKKWCAIKDCDNTEGLNNERHALGEMAANFSGFDLRGGAILIDGSTKAIGIGEELNKNMFVIHILKAEPKIKGLYQTMMNELVANECGRYDFVNMEQDLGIEGLRKAKLSYNPIGMVKKYFIRRRK